MTPPRRHITAIVNPTSGRRTMVPRVKRIAKLLSLRGAELTILVTQSPGHARQLAASLPPETEALLIAGGDGTVHEVLNGLQTHPPLPRGAKRDPQRDQGGSGAFPGDGSGSFPRRGGFSCNHLPMFLFRAGTENLAARELNMPVDPDRVVQTLLHGRPCPCDLGEVNGRRFLAICGIGFDAECVIRMSKVRRGHITHADYFWPIWRAFWSYQFPELRIEADEKLVFEGRGLALISNIPRYSVGMNLLWKAKWDDGLLDVGIFPCSNRTTLVAHAARALLGLHETRGKMQYFQAKSIRCTSPSTVPIEVDGELGGSLPVVCTIHPGAASFLQEMRAENRLAANSGAALR